MFLSIKSRKMCVIIFMALVLQAIPALAMEGNRPPQKGPKSQNYKPFLRTNKDDKNQAILNVIQQGINNWIIKEDEGSQDKKAVLEQIMDNYLEFKLEFKRDPVSLGPVLKKMKESLRTVEQKTNAEGGQAFATIRDHLKQDLDAIKKIESQFSANLVHGIKVEEPQEPQRLVIKDNRNFKKAQFQKPKRNLFKEFEQKEESKSSKEEVTHDPELQEALRLQQEEFDSHKKRLEENFQKALKLQNKNNALPTELSKEEVELTSQDERSDVLSGSNASSSSSIVSALSSSSEYSDNSAERASKRATDKEEEIGAGIDRDEIPSQQESKQGQQSDPVEQKESNQGSSQSNPVQDNTTGVSKAKIALGLGGLAAVTFAGWRLYTYLKPYFDSSLDEQANDLANELESRDIVLKQAKVELQLCEDLIKKAQAALTHAGDMQFVQALWERAKHLGSIVGLEQGNVRQIEQLISQKNPQAIIDKLTECKPALEERVKTAEHQRKISAESKKRVEFKRDNRSFFGLIKEGMVKDLNKGASWVGMGPYFNASKKAPVIAPKKLPAVVAKVSNQGGMTSTVTEARDYLGGLNHLKAVVQQAVNGDYVKGQEGWMVTDALNSKRCAVVRTKLPELELKNLQTTIAQFEQSFAHQDPTVRANAVNQRYNECNQLIETLKTTGIGQQSQQIIDDYNRQVDHQRTEKQRDVCEKPKVQKSKEETAISNDKPESKVPAGRSKRDVMPEAAEQDEEHLDEGAGLFEKGFNWIQNNKLLAGGLLALTALGVSSEVFGWWPFENKAAQE